MMIGIFDIILIIILAGFVFYGLFFGLIRTLGSLIGVIAGFFLAAKFYLPAFDFIQNLFFGHDDIGKIVTFIILFTLINRLVCFIFVLVNKTYDIISIIPFLKTINRLAGAVFGFLLGGVVLGFLFFIVSNNFFIGNWFIKFLDNSRVAPFLIKFVDILKPLLPEMLKKLQSII
jgi:membrane protein required for colicin V production